jgi:hypothetical protein
MIGWLGADYFRVEPLSDMRKCTVKSVAAHTLYEKTNPYILPGPGGVLDLYNTVFTQESENSVKVMGSAFIPAKPNYIKLEGARSAGFRTVSICATADPVMMSQMDNIIPAVKIKVESNFAGTIDKFALDFKVYGQNQGVAGIFAAAGYTPKSPGNMQLTDEERKSPHIGQREAPSELCIIIDAVASSQEQANTVCSFARSTLLHYGYEGRISTAGNLAFPFSPSDFKVGEVFEFSVYHLMEAPDPCEYFDVEIRTVG